MKHLRLLVALALTGLVIACSARVPAETASTGPLSLQVVAHQDDDLLFMNPDLGDDIRAGRQVVTVYLTSGESNAADVPGYVAQRQEGVRAAYAAMAGAPDEWRGSALRIDADHSVEQYELSARPGIKLIFVNLPEDHGGQHALRKLWADRSESVRAATLVPSGAKVPRSYRYTRYALLDLLQTLMTRFQPTVVRTQDTHPDTSYPHWQPFYDHPDHLMTARFTEEAALLYRRSAKQPVFVQVGYRDYNVEQVPVNLDQAQQRDKLDDFARYRVHDPMVGDQQSYQDWPRRMYHRWPRGVSWVGRDEHGDLRAFAVRSGQVTAWTRRDGAWTSTDLAPPGGVLAPALSVATGRDGLHVCGRRTDKDTITCWRGGTWTDLDSPSPGTDVGAPFALATPDGPVSVFVRTSGGGVARVSQAADGSWGKWEDLGGSGILDGLAAVNGPDGVEVFGTTTTGVQRWHNGWDAAFPSATPAAAPVVLRDALLYRVALTGEVAISKRTPTGWTTPVLVPGPGGPGQVAAVDRNGLVLVGRDADGAVTTTHELPGGGFAPWTPRKTPTVDYPAVVPDDNGVLALAIGPDGQLATDPLT
ncbi:PIG-L family deacetylase [Umezawaea tangerina]|uniref:GlcNAc-PI de-N-acetylase n=1 Tax=Umezawaea tangerina TaxID=84725 RepID=A0A2T0TK07_9PSEU|nr:PIG-L family deacetylase [Umezawaea tangerina]PRY46047.1 GlcNAc-PI de-N-acetylase [Umezawaea tangerina]